MAIELSQNPVSAPEQSQHEELKKQVQEGMQGQEEGLTLNNNMSEQVELELHRACAGGNLDEVRAVLSRGLEQLEILDINTGCTPIVLAIRGNFPDVVRELLAAGAIIPPPGLTNDPVMLSLLYPQPMYGHGLPPQFMGHQPMAMAPEFYPQGFYDQRNGQMQAQANLPPADVAKTIPCRNFPNCKYGASCVFFHPRGPGQAGFYAPNGPGPFQYEGYQGYQPMPYFNPQANGFQPQQQIDEQSQQFQQPSSSSEAAPQETSENAPQAQQFNEQQQQQLPPHEMSTAPPPFVPYGMTSPIPAQFGLSPMSPPMMAMPMSPHDAAFFAQSPPNGMMPPPSGMNGNGFVPRRLSVNQGPNGFQGKPFHGQGGKKPSFSGGPRPWSGPGRNPSWKDGTPPPCAFFAQSKCRNGEFCKFPHMDQEGNDCRHPDVIRGVMAPAPPLARVQRPMRMGNFGGFDPSRQFVPRAAMTEEEAATQVPAPVEAIAETDAASTEAAAPAPTPAPAAEESTQAELPAKPVQPANNNSAIQRATSQPGVQRFQGNGFHSRAQSPAPSNVSFHGNGHPRRAGRPFNNAVPGNQGVRSVSAGNANGGASKQRIPNADEFPALGGASGNTSPQEKSTATFSKTAAQVLSAPAPPKPEVVKQESTEDEVTMADESDSDAVIITMNKPTEKATTPAQAEEATSAPAPAQEDKASKPTSAAKPSTISFASVASAIKEISATSGSIESAPVALKA